MNVVFLVEKSEKSEYIAKSGEWEQMCVLKVNRVFLMLINRIWTNYCFASSHRLFWWLSLFLFFYTDARELYWKKLSFIFLRQFWRKVVCCRVNKNKHFKIKFQDLAISNPNFIWYKTCFSLLCCLTFAWEGSERQTTRVQWHFIALQCGPWKGNRSLIAAKLSLFGYYALINLHSNLGQKV